MHCGTCNWHDEIKLKKVYCLFHDRWFDINYTCENFIDYSYLNREERSRRATEARKRVEAQAKDEQEKQEAERRAQDSKLHAEEIARINRKHEDKLHQMRMKFDKKMWWNTLWWQIILAVISAGLGFGAAWFLKK